MPINLTSKVCSTNQIDQPTSVWGRV